MGWVSINGLAVDAICELQIQGILNTIMLKKNL
jgi:hypothetical protein